AEYGQVGAETEERDWDRSEKRVRGPPDGLAAVGRAHDRAVGVVRIRQICRDPHAYQGEGRSGLDESPLPHRARTASTASRNSAGSSEVTCSERSARPVRPSSKAGVPRTFNAS